MSCSAILSIVRWRHRGAAGPWNQHASVILGENLCLGLWDHKNLASFLKQVLTGREGVLKRWCRALRRNHDAVENLVKIVLAVLSSVCSQRCALAALVPSECLDRAIVPWLALAAARDPAIS